MIASPTEDLGFELSWAQPFAGARNVVSAFLSQ